MTCLIQSSSYDRVLALALAHLAAELGAQTEESRILPGGSWVKGGVPRPHGL